MFASFFRHKRPTIGRLDIKIAIALFVLALGFRLWTVQHNQVIFYWDQARDALVAQEMARGDLKIQGPSASGSNDMIFHGVLYYYLIAPVYALGQGNPLTVAAYLALLGAVAAPMMYALSKSVFSSRPLAIASGMLLAFSFDSAQVHTWISNPSFSGTATLLFFWGVWETFFQKKNRWLIVTLFALGLANQSVVFSATLWAVVAAAYIIRAENEKNYRLFSWRELAVSGGVYTVMVASLALSELLIWRAGILDWRKLAELSQQGGSIARALLDLYEVVVHKKMVLQALPTKPLLGIVGSLFLLWVALKRISRSQQLFSFLWLSSPLWLYFIQVRRSYHSLAGWEGIWYLLLPVAVWSLFRTKAKYTALAIFTGLFVLSNIAYVRGLNVSTFNELGIQQGADLRSQLALIDEIYARAEGEPFSLSTLTNPYGINTTWAYLFPWYGQPRYGYLPQFFGPDQTGLFGAGRLEPTQDPLPHHFVIIEPDIPPGFDARFLPEQEIFSGTASAVFKQDELRLYEYDNR